MYFENFDSDGDKHETSEQAARFAWDLANSYYWSGNVVRDYLFFVAQWHPLLGICYSHPAHPWSKDQRLIMLLVTVAVTTLPSARLMRILDASGGDDETQIATHLEIFAHITLPVMLGECALYRLAVLDLYCKGRRGPCCRVCGRLVQCMQRCCFLAALIFSGLMLFASSCLLLGSSLMGGNSLLGGLRLIMVSCIQSWITWFPIWLVLPYVGFLHYWHIEQRQGI